VRTGEQIEWFEAAKQMTELANSTDASRRFKKFCAWSLHHEKPEKGSALRKLLKEAVNGSCPDIPEQLIGKLKVFYPLFDKLRKAAKRA
jgi:hypothetical protein